MAIPRMPVRRDRRIDELDREAFEAMLESKAWRIYQERLQLMHRQLVEDAIYAKGMVEVRRAQGGVHALRSAIALPGIMLDEMRKRKLPNNPA